MDDKSAAWWLGGGSVTLLVTTGLAILGYMRNPPLIRASRVIDMREELKSLREHADRCDRELRDVRERLIPEMRDENQWLLGQIRRLQDRADRYEQNRKEQ